jgi:hypothetical protein
MRKAARPAAKVRLMRGNAPEDAEWNRGLTPQRVLDAAADFARAVALDPADEDARHSLRWLVDLICTTWTFHGFFRDPANERARDIFARFRRSTRRCSAFFPQWIWQAVGSIRRR